MLPGKMSAAIGAAGMLALVCAADPPALAELQRSANSREAICWVVDATADTYRLPASFLTRVLWQESGFRADVTSPAGAAGVAQFMPETAAERGLGDPYDPGRAVPEAARFLAELVVKFGSTGLAAAAYNAGAARVTRWLNGEAGLPAETQLYVLAVTGHHAEEWRSGRRDAPAAIERGNCLGITAGLATLRLSPALARSASPRMAVWQLRLDEFLSRAVRLKDQRPGTVPISGANRAAESLCNRIRALGAPCAVYER
jgi:hypothetical protein